MSSRKAVWGEAVARYVADRLDKQIVAPYAAYGVEIDGEIIGGVIFNHWTGPDVHMTVAADRRAWSRDSLADIGNHIFGSLGCERVTLVTEQPSVVKLAKGLGGQIEGLMRNHFGKGRDGVVLGILKAEWKF